MTATISRLPSPNTYTLAYDEPTQVCHNPVEFEYNFQTVEFPAQDERDARKQADAFLARNKISCNNVEAKRRGRYIDQMTPIFKPRIHEYVTPNKVKTAARG